MGEAPFRDPHAIPGGVASSYGHRACISRPAGDVQIVRVEDGEPFGSFPPVAHPLLIDGRTAYAWSPDPEHPHRIHILSVPYGGDLPAPEPRLLKTVPLPEWVDAVWGEPDRFRLRAEGVGRVLRLVWWAWPIRPDFESPHPDALEPGRRATIGTVDLDTDSGTIRSRTVRDDAAADRVARTRELAQTLPLHLYRQGDRWINAPIRTEDSELLLLRRNPRSHTPGLHLTEQDPTTGFLRRTVQLSSHSSPLTILSTDGSCLFVEDRVGTDNRVWNAFSLVEKRPLGTLPLESETSGIAMVGDYVMYSTDDVRIGPRREEIVRTRTLRTTRRSDGRPMWSTILFERTETMGSPPSRPEPPLHE